jgi:SAM-dependent methyltransferase
VLYFAHTLGNRLITFGADFFTDLNLTDVETCYKAVRTRLLQSIPIRSNDFRLEIELTFKLAKRGARIFEVPISYAGRTYEEGKKIGVIDGLLAFVAMLRWWIVDDIYDPDEYGSNILVALSEVPRFNRWMADTIRPFVGQRVLEIGAGLGNLTRALMPRDRYTATDINPHYLDYLANFAESRPYLDVRRFDLADPSASDGVAGQYDTVVCLNVLEHVAQEAQGARNLFSALVPGGRAIVLVPQGPSLYGTLDRVLGHERRYTTAMLQATLEGAGFDVERIFGFNRASRPGWWLNGTLLERERFSRIQLKILDWMIWLIRRIDRMLPWPGVSLIAVARRPLGAVVPHASVVAATVAIPERA